MGVSKVVYGGNTIIDLTADTVTADKILSGFTAHGANGEIIEGVCDYDSNTQDATANASEILTEKVAYNKGNRIVGKMPNNGAVSGIINDKDGAYTVPQGYHDGSGKVGISETEKSKLIPANIKSGVTILGVVGTHEGDESVTVQTKSVVPSSTEQTVLPDEGYDYLAQVNITAIPYVESNNSAGGITVTIG